MSAEKNVPAIRIEGFSDEWEYRNLGSIYNKIRNAFVGTATPYYVESGNFYLESNNVKNGVINRNTEIFISDEFYKKQSDKWLKTGDIVMVQSGHVGHTAVIPPELNNIAAHALIMFTNPKEVINPYFFNFQFQTAKSKKRLSEITTGNTIKHILSSEMKEFYVYAPHSDEQTKIGHYFQQLDTLIAQHQKKHDKLLNLKKALLEKMFSRQDATKPEIRFKGFKEEWFQEKVLNIAPLQRGFDLPKSAMKIGTYPVVMSNGINGYHIKFKAKAPGIVTGRSGTIGNIHYIEDDYWPHNTALWVTNCKGNLPRFIYYLYIKLNLKRFGTGSGVPTLNRNDVHEQYISLPKETEEQTKISQLFKNLDTLIAQHRAQLKKLRNIKQACLDKMFV